MKTITASFFITYLFTFLAQAQISPGYIEIQNYDSAPILNGGILYRNCNATNDCEGKTWTEMSKQKLSLVPGKYEVKVDHVVGVEVRPNEVTVVDLFKLLDLSLYSTINVFTKGKEEKELKNYVKGSLLFGIKNKNTNEFSLFKLGTYLIRLGKYSIAPFVRYHGWPSGSYTRDWDYANIVHKTEVLPQQTLDVELFLASLENVPEHTKKVYVVDTEVVLHLEVILDWAFRKTKEICSSARRYKDNLSRKICKSVMQDNKEEFLSLSKLKIQHQCSFSFVGIQRYDYSDNKVVSKLLSGYPQGCVPLYIEGTNYLSPIFAGKIKVIYEGDYGVYETTLSLP